MNEKNPPVCTWLSGALRLLCFWSWAFGVGLMCSVMWMVLAWVVKGVRNIEGYVPYVCVVPTTKFTANINTEHLAVSPRTTATTRVPQWAAVSSIRLDIDPKKWMAPIQTQVWKIRQDENERIVHGQDIDASVNEMRAEKPKYIHENDATQ